MLCRLALKANTIDPASFTIVRLSSGIVVLCVIFYVATQNNPPDNKPGSWASSLALFVYALAFSYAYITLDTGSGALMLFGSVQIAMIVWQLITGKRLRGNEWLGVIVAFSGLTYLVYPSLSTPSFWGLSLMALAGVAWAVYTLRGKSAANPLTDTAFNFFRTTPFILFLLVLSWDDIQLSSAGILYACLSGAIASGIGYAVWYVALEKISATEAAVTQLSVPAIAAVGGVLYVGDTIDRRLGLAGVLILGGILLVVMARKPVIRNINKSP